MKPIYKLVFLIVILTYQETLGIATESDSRGLAPPNSGSLPQAAATAGKESSDKGSGIILKGWMKWFTYMSQMDFNKRPSKFEINPAYKDQFTKKANITFTDKDKDQFGWFDIPDETSFFFLMTSKAIYAVTSRRVSYLFYFLQRV